ncbi:MATE family efflux transporter [Brasilonema bromeliae SPC951]|uniref:Multidrug export protein MepA n=2 Tax=Bromeliae group (in: Brasilonema) TaxID=3398495 RepID=A0ABX1P9G0_9CYAN|nr:MATE family efflux transporter [Brasilonema bromeliae SPC951]
MTSQKQSQLTNEILQGNLVKLMFKLSIPGILGMLLLGLNIFVDALFAGQLIGETAVAGISLALPLTNILTGFAMLVGVGSASVLSRAIGSFDIKTQSKIFGNLIVMSVVISLVITIISYSFGEELILFMGGSGKVASAGAEYFKTYMLGSVFYILAVASNQIIKSEGKIRIATIFTVIYVIVNIIFNFIFVSVFQWGIQGIALATVLAMVVHSIVNLTYFLSGKSSIPVHPKKFVLAVDLLPAILSVGIPALLTQVMGLVQSSVVFKSISYYGTQNDIAFYGATLTLTSLTYVPLNGFTQALQPVIGINYGAGNYDRLKKAYLTFVNGGITVLTFFWLLLQLSPNTFLGWLLPDVAFTSNDFLNFRILSLLIPIMPLVFLGATLFQSLGKGKIVTIIILLRSLFLFIPLVLILSNLIAVTGIYYGMLMTDILVILIVLILILIKFEHLTKMQLNKYK